MFGRDKIDQPGGSAAGPSAAAVHGSATTVVPVMTPADLTAEAAGIPNQSPPVLQDVAGPEFIMTNPISPITSASTTATPAAADSTNPANGTADAASAGQPASPSLSLGTPSAPVMEPAALPEPAIQVSVSTPEPAQTAAPAVEATIADNQALAPGLPAAVAADDNQPPAFNPVPPATIAAHDHPALPGLPEDLQTIKQEAIKQLTPLVDQLEQTPEDKFRTAMMMLQATDDQSLIKVAYEAAQSIEDEKVRAQALLDVVNEINYFTQQDTK